MSFLSNLFHKRAQSSGTNSPRETGDFESEEELEEDFEIETDPELIDKGEEETDLSTTEEEEYEVVEREIHPAKIICPDCGGITLEGLEFCDKCGGELQ